MKPLKPPAASAPPPPEPVGSGAQPALLQVILCDDPVAILAGLQSMLERGATAFVPMSDEFDDITQAMQLASQGPSCVSARVVLELILVRSAQRNPRTLLSLKDLQLFRHCTEVTPLAQALGSSEKTVQNRLTQMSKTLAVPRGALHVVAREYGLIDL